MGEWSSLGNPSAGGDAMDRAYSFFSQPAFVVPIQGLEGRFILAADQWNEMDLGSSRYALSICCFHLEKVHDCFIESYHNMQATIVSFLVKVH